MMKPGPNDKVYPVAKIATVVESLRAEGVSPADSLAGVLVVEAQLHSPATRVSANQVLQTYRNALRLSRDPQFAYRTGFHFHVSTYGMYGFAILSSSSFRQTMAFATEYHELATPLAEMTFHEEDKRAIWTIVPEPFKQIDDLLTNSSSSCRWPCILRFIETSWGRHSGHPSSIFLLVARARRKGMQSFLTARSSMGDPKTHSFSIRRGWKADRASEMR
jgi:hypothetical protein